MGSSTRQNTAQNTGQASVQRRQPASTRRAYHHHDTGGSAWLWFLVLGAAVLIALLLAAWDKHQRHMRAMHTYQHDLAQYQNELRIAAQEAEQSGMAPPTTAPGAPDYPARTLNERRPTDIPEACQWFINQIPTHAQVILAGAYRGAYVPAAATNNGVSTPGSRFQINVNRPGAPLLLVLSAHDASVWRVDVAAGTTLAGVMFSGAREQTLENALPNVPILHTSPTSNASCGIISPDGNDMRANTDIIVHLFKRMPVARYVASDGLVQIGASITANPAPNPSTNAGPNYPPRPYTNRTPSPAGSAPRVVEVERYIDENGHTAFREVPRHAPQQQQQ